MFIAMCDCLSENPPSLHLPVFQKIPFKIQFKKPALPWYWTHSLSINILSYLLAFAQLTWQVDNDWVLPVFDDFSWNSLILGQHIWGGRWEEHGVRWVVAKAQTKKQDDTKRAAMTCTCIHKDQCSTTIPRQTCTDIGGHIRSTQPNWMLPLVPFYQSWIYMVGKSTLEKQTSQH